MKFKKILTYKIFKFFFKKYSRLFSSFYKHKLNSNLIDLIKKGVEIKTVYDIGAYKGDYSNFLNKTSLKGKDFYLFEANEENEKYLKKLNFKYFIYCSRFGDPRLYSIIGHSKYISLQFEIALFAPFKISISLPWVSIFIKSGKGKLFCSTILSRVFVVLFFASKSS